MSIITKVTQSIKVWVIFLNLLIKYERRQGFKLRVRKIGNQEVSGLQQLSPLLFTLHIRILRA